MNGVGAPVPVATGPFYAYAAVTAMTSTYGGPSVAADTSVKRIDGSRIEGLCAAGEVVGGPRRVPHDGDGLTKALVFGFEAADTIAPRLTGRITAPRACLVANAALALVVRIESVQRGDERRRQLRHGDGREVLSLTGGVRGLHDGHDPFRPVPAKDGLSGRTPGRLRNAKHDRIGQEVRHARAGSKTGRTVPCSQVSTQGSTLDRRIALDLVDGGDQPGLVHQPSDVVRLEVGHADRTDQSLVGEARHVEECLENCPSQGSGQWMRYRST